MALGPTDRLNAYIKYSRYNSKNLPAPSPEKKEADFLNARISISLGTKANRNPARLMEGLIISAPVMGSFL